MFLLYFDILSLISGCAYVAFRVASKVILKTDIFFRLASSFAQILKCRVRRWTALILYFMRSNRLLFPLVFGCYSFFIMHHSFWCLSLDRHSVQ